MTLKSDAPSGATPASDVAVSVVIPTYNRSALLRRCLLSLSDQDYPGGYEVIVVDDGSEDDTARVVAALEGQVRFPIRYFFQPNQGPAAARNLGIAHVRGKITAFIDDDHIASATWLSQISRVPPEGAVVGLCGRNRSLPGRTRVARYCALRGLHEAPPVRENGAVQYLITGNAAIRTEVLRAVGGFDVRFRAAFRGIAPGGEDTALNLSLQRQGFQVFFCPDAITDHQQKESLRAFLRENFNFGCNRILLHHTEGHPVAGFAACRRFLRSVLSVVVWLRPLRGFRRKGVGWTDSLAFCMIEKAAFLCFEAGLMAGTLTLRRRLREGI